MRRLTAPSRRRLPGCFSHLLGYLGLRSSARCVILLVHAGAAVTVDVVAILGFSGGIGRARHGRTQSRRSRERKERSGIRGENETRARINQSEVTDWSYRDRGTVTVVESAGGMESEV